MDSNRLNGIIKKASQVVEVDLDSYSKVMEKERRSPGNTFRI